MRQDFERSLTFLSQKIDDLNVQAGSFRGKEELLNKQILEMEEKLEIMAGDKELYSKCVEVLSLAQESVKMGIKSGFESVVTYALQYIFGSSYLFELEFGRRGNLQEVDLNVKTEILTDPYDPMDTSGGGVVDVVAIALRVAMIELHQPKIEGPLVFDESFKHLSRKYLPQAGSFLMALKDRVRRQVIMVTHSPELVSMADNIIEVK